MDRRVKYTQKVIKDAFIKLLDEKDIKKITVSKICEIADINRATFYRYYLDVYDLLDKIQLELLEALKKEAYKDDETPTVFSFANDMLNVLLENKDLVATLFSTNNNIYFLYDFLEVAFEKFKELWAKDESNISNEKIEYATTFIFNGALGIINYWVINDFDKTPHELAKIIESLTYYGTSRFIHQKDLR